MTYVEMRHSGISHDIKTNFEIVPKVGEIVDFSNNDEQHLFVVERVVHCYEDHKLVKIYIAGKQIQDWLN
jgi:hypothetical protein